MLNTALASLKIEDEMTVSRDVLESLPQSLYRALPWPNHTIDSCVKIVAEAQRTNNPRRVRAWIDFERNTPSGEDIMGCLDTVIHELTQPGEGFADRIRFANKLRQEALDYMRALGAMASAKTTVDPYAAAQADGLVAAMRLHDPELAEHAEITAQLATRMAVGMGVDAATVARVTLTARLHDIGKMRISRSIMNKPMPLTAAEREEVQSYPSIGSETLAAMPALAEIAVLVRAQREWFDGRGYPAGVAHEEIPLESRIVALVDAFHTMTLARPYRNALSSNEAMTQIVAGSGTQFDPDLVTEFTAMLGYRGRIAQSA
jgi:HD-GYP domain-containing protein (c-di-GMP phosphodiesterase class II)